MSNRINQTIGVFISQFANVVLTFLALPYLSRALSVQDYGTYSMTILILDSWLLLFSFGIGKVFYIQLAKAGSNTNSVVKSTLIASFLIGSIGTLLCILCSPLIAFVVNVPSVRPLIQIYSLSLPFQILSQVLSVVLIYSGRAVLSSRIVVVVSVIRMLTMILIIQKFNNLQLMFWAQFIITILYCIWLLRSTDIISIFSSSVSKKIVYTNLLLGWPIALTSLLGYMFRFTDSMVIGSKLSIEDYAIYRNGAFELPFLSTIYSSISVILLPDIVRLIESKSFDAVIQLKRKIISFTSSLLLPIMVFCLIFNYEIITYYFSNKYEKSALIFGVYSLILFIRTNSHEDILIATANSKKILNIYILSVLVNILLVYTLISIWGAIGAAMATVITFYFLAWLQAYQSCLVLNSSILKLYDVKNLAGIVGISLFFSGITHILWSWLSPSLMFFLFLFSAYMITVLHFELKANLLDRELILKIFALKFKPLVPFVEKLYPIKVNV